ncbi:STP1 protein [Plasmodium ovale wallikeri]|uniref:STP1 protein n=1 Tax=Plasmodium ovale wallikeri TaxID=864142 RepID=A0A1A9AE12_PLAOA|nr:STP1 protein [Plasmodium ovale wallikeri]
MQRGQYNCDKIKAASKKQTNDIFIRYKTPILDGAIKIINQFKKDKNDGVHYKKLCEELLKYVKAQKKCVREEVSNEGKSLTAREWNKIVNALYTTFNSQKIKRLCYLENDKEETTKKYILNIHEVFRNFCIEKKARLRNISDMNFEQCNDYMSWITEKKRGLQAIDPNYENIREYKEYFDIHHNCNYPWLVGNINDVTCSQLTKSRAAKKDKANTAMGDNNQNPTLITHVTPPDEKKDISPAAQPSAKGDVNPPSAKTSGSIPGKEPTKTTTTDHSNSGYNDDEQIRNTVWLLGDPVSESPPVPKLIPVSKNSPDYNDPEVQKFLYYFRTNLDGNKITHDVLHSNNAQTVKIPKIYKTHVPINPRIPIVNKPYDYIPPQLPRTQRFPPPYPRGKLFAPPNTYAKPFQTSTIPSLKYATTTKSKKRRVHFFPQEFPPFPIITSGNKKMEVVKIQLPMPDPSLFRSPIMIYMLGFLILFTIIAMLFFLSKYTSFGLLFNKKKKKKRLKRNLEIKKIPEESPHLDNTDNHSVNDMPYKNKTHNDNSIYGKIKIQKGVINKNISLPKKKNNKRKAIIDIHMELLNEYKNDEWDLNKNDFLQICLEEFIREQNKIYSNSENTNLVMKNISIQNTKEDKMLLLDEWTERCRPIWEKFKSENAFKVLQYEWKEAEKEYLENIEQFENNILNENTKISYKEIKKEIWRKWITKQATFIKQFTQEKWFKSLVKQIEDVSDEYKMEEIKDDIFVLNIEKLDNINNKEESYKHDNNPYLIKVLTQIFMMVIEECIKEESPEKKELMLDNIIEKLNKEKHAKIESKNIHQENMNHKEYDETLETDTHKYKDSLKELMEGWTNKSDIDINSADDKNKSDKSVEVTDEKFLNPNDDTSENTINYIQKE